MQVLTKTSDLATQRFLNGEIHNWYRIVLGYPDHLVSELIEQLKIRPGQRVLDPFCGTGTTLVECMKNGISCVGIDANPSSCFAARVKTTWNLNPDRLLRLAFKVNNRIDEKSQFKKPYRTDPTYIYLEQSGMIERGWISPEPLRKAILIKTCIAELNAPTIYKNALMLALIAEVVYKSSNMKFGPEIYRSNVRMDADVLLGFTTRINRMADDLQTTRTMSPGEAKVIFGDSRMCDQLLEAHTSGLYDAVICSPPYPTEHDYTRNSRLELVFLEKVFDRKSLQAIKKNMIRSHTKGIYKEDDDARLVERHSGVNAVVSQLKERIVHKSHGFARLYPTVVQAYFGGMKRHLISVRKLLGHKAMCAYVLGDQSSYLRVHIPTAEILASIADDVGFNTIEVRHWRSRWSSTTSKKIDENILLLQRRN